MSAEKPEYWFVFQNDRLLIQKHDHKLLTSSNITPFKQDLIRQHLIAQFENFIIYGAELSPTIALSNEFETLALRHALEILGTDWYNMAAKAYSIMLWDKNHQYCGRCGHVTTVKSNQFERICPNCSLAFYPRISPSIIVLIHRGDEILMARGPHFPPGVHALIAGFVEAGENIEDAVHREVQEEVGIKIKHLKYFGSQAWPFPDSLMIGFYAEYDSGELTPHPDEIEAAGWYRYDQLPGLPSTSISISRKLIDHFVAEKMK